MNIHEYQAKQLLAEFGLQIPDGIVACTLDEAAAAIKKINHPVQVIKAQIHAGGRGKGGGVKVTNSPSDAMVAVREILGMQLVTPQTGSVGKKVNRIYIEQGCDIKRELYLGMLIDRQTAQLTIIASTEGGMEIEQVAAESPQKIIRIAIDPSIGLSDVNCQKLGDALGLNTQIKTLTKFLNSMYTAFIKLDASLIEINPLVVTLDNQLLVLDAKMNFDSNSLFRQPKIMQLRDLDEEDPTEIQAAEYGLSYIKLDGDIGCMVNGAGLAMATMDIIKLSGGSPANFLDVGGGASSEKVSAAFKIILADKNVKCILVNIFGGIMKCDVIANGIVAAARDMHIHLPLVVRLAGTNVDNGKKILDESGLDIISATDLSQAAEKAVQTISH